MSNGWNIFLGPWMEPDCSHSQGHILNLRWPEINAKILHHYCSIMCSKVPLKFYIYNSQTNTDHLAKGKSCLDIYCVIECVTFQNNAMRWAPSVHWICLWCHYYRLRTNTVLLHHTRSQKKLPRISPFHTKLQTAFTPKVEGIFDCVVKLHLKSIESNKTRVGVNLCQAKQMVQPEWHKVLESQLSVNAA